MSTGGNVTISVRTKGFGAVALVRARLEAMAAIARLDQALRARDDGKREGQIDNAAEHLRRSLTILVGENALG